MVPLFGQLLLDSTDITRTLNAVNISAGDKVVVRCADGYELVFSDSNLPLGASQSTITCMDGGTWSPTDINNLTCLKQSGKLIIMCITISATLCTPLLCRLDCMNGTVKTK